MTPLQMYLLILVTKLPELGKSLMGVSGLAATVSGVFLFTCLVNSDTEDEFDLKLTKSLTKTLKMSVVFFVFGFCINFFGVDIKQLALVYGVPAVVNNEQVQKLPDNVLKVVNTWLEEKAQEKK